MNLPADLPARQRQLSRQRHSWYSRSQLPVGTDSRYREFAGSVRSRADHTVCHGCSSVAAAATVARMPPKDRSKASARLAVVCLRSAGCKRACIAAIARASVASLACYPQH